MKLNKLTIRNIASISKSEIDFTKEPLCSAPIFFICGETGSGKTTLLDAICLALYNKTPRLSNGVASGDTKYIDANNQEIDIKKVKQLLKKGETEGSIRLSFEGADGSLYQADWSCAMAPRAHTIKDEEWTVTDSDGHTRNANKAIMEEITGMDFDQFCRTSMLPQGEFTRFLKADTKDKSDILEKITGTEVYAKIAKAIYDKYTAARREKEAIERDLGNIVVLSDTDVEKYTGELSAISADIEKNKLSIDLMEKLVAAFDEIDRATADRDRAERTREKSRETFLQLCSDLAYREDEKQNKEAGKASLDDSVMARASLAPMFANAQTIAENLRDVKRQEAVKAAKSKDKSDAEARMDELRKTRQECKATYDSVAKELDAKKAAVVKAEAERAELGPDSVEQERKDIISCRSVIAGAREEWAGIAAGAKRIGEDTEALGNLKKEIESDEAALEGKRAAARTAEEVLASTRALYDSQKESIDKAVMAIREKLISIGATECPVCHAKISSLNTSDEEIEMVRPAREAFEKADNAFKEASRECTEAETALGVKKAEFSKKEGSLNKLTESTAKRSAGFASKFPTLGIEEGKDIPGTIDIADNNLKLRANANEEALGLIKAKDAEIASFRKAADDYGRITVEPAKAALDKAEKAIIEAEGVIKAAIQGIEDAGKAASESFGKAAKLILYADWEPAWTADPEGFISSLKDEAEAYDKDVRSQEAMAAEITALAKQIEEARDVRDAILKDNADFTAESVEKVRFQGNASVAWGALGSTVNTCNTTILHCGKTVQDNEAHLNEEFSRDETLPKSKDELSAMKASKINDNTVLGERKGQLDTILSDNEEKNRLLKDKVAELDAANAVFEKWSSLNTVFGGPDAMFKKIAQSYIMQDILNHANEYLHRIAPRYKLFAQPGSLIILVKEVDKDIVRSGNTLSGGEGFVVSLSLALGLSDLADAHVSADTIFIDEGFGTLSKEWLDSVMSTLKKLNSTSGKHIGMITHMQELQKEIGTWIEVRRVDSTSSETFVHPED